MGGAASPPRCSSCSGCDDDTQAAYKRRIAAAPDPDAYRAELYAEMNKFRFAFRTADVFGVEDVIDPRETRPRLCAWVQLACRVARHGDMLRAWPGLFLGSWAWGGGEGMCMRL